jgi:hypothetical protein
MNRNLGITLVASIGTASLAGVTITAGQTPFVLDRLYTTIQANRGQVLYRDSCESCHAPDLAGGKAVPEIVGPTFITRWSGQTIGQLFDRVLVSMPEDDPSSVSRQAKIDIVSFILRANGFAAGEVELTGQTANLNQFEFKPVTR